MSNVTAASSSSSAFVPFAGYNSGDTAWILMSSALVFFMTPGLALFYAGLVRSKHSVNMLGQNMAALAVVSIQWFFWGYSLSFSGGSYIYGSLSKMFFGNTQINAPHELAPTIPELAFAVYQMMFAIITPALITGATADRFKLGPYLLFLFLWSTLVYNPICHMVWAPYGWMRQMGVLDFAGGLVVHVAAASSALVCSVFLGERHKVSAGEQLNAPHSPVLVVIGTGILWFGWFGFNSGSAENDGVQAVAAFTSSHIAAAFAGLTWWGLEVWQNDERKPTVIGLCTGFVAGLAAVTPAAGFVEPLPAMAIGVVSAFVGYYMIRNGERWGLYDDALGVFAVHGCGSAVGVLLTGVFANSGVSGYAAPTNTFVIDGESNDNAGGWISHNYRQLGVQLLCLVVVIAWAVTFTTIIMTFLKHTTGIRVDEKDELRGLDHAVHSEYAFEYDHPEWVYSAKRGHGLVDKHKGKPTSAVADEESGARHRPASVSVAAAEKTSVAVVPAAAAAAPAPAPAPASAYPPYPYPYPYPQPSYAQASWPRRPAGVATTNGNGNGNGNGAGAVEMTGGASNASSGSSAAFESALSSWK